MISLLGRRARGLGFIIVAALGGCAGGECRAPFAGDPAQPVEVVPALTVAVDGGAALVEIKDGDKVGLQPPPQGGFVLYVGARLRHLDPCGVFIGALLRDPVTDAVRSNLDRRNGDLVAEPGSGWFVPKALASFSSVANLPACPDDLGAGIVGQTLKLELTITERGGRRSVATRTVVPTCGGGPCEAECRCQCGRGYVPGKCAQDGGAGDAGVCER